MNNGKRNINIKITMPVLIMYAVGHRFADFRFYQKL